MLAQSQTFPCPNCGEIINDSVQTCRFCSAPVDPQAASAAAELQTRVNRACSDASFVRTAAAAMFVLLALSIVPFISLITYLGFIITFFVVLVLLVRWQIKIWAPANQRRRLQSGEALLDSCSSLVVGCDPSLCGTRHSGDNNRACICVTCSLTNPRRKNRA